jgi:hypothetical protein
LLTNSPEKQKRSKWFISILIFTFGFALVSPTFSAIVTGVAEQKFHSKQTKAAFSQSIIYVCLLIWNAFGWTMWYFDFRKENSFILKPLQWFTTAKQAKRVSLAYCCCATVFLLIPSTLLFIPSMKLSVNRQILQVLDPEINYAWSIFWTIVLNVSGISGGVRTTR